MLNKSLLWVVLQFIYVAAFLNPHVVDAVPFTGTPINDIDIPKVTAYVDPLIATRGSLGMGGWGNAQRGPHAMSPFPFLRLGPDTTRIDPLIQEIWSQLNRHSGYFGSDNAIRAFSHTHLQGAGDADYGNIGIMISRFSSLSSLQDKLNNRPVFINGINFYLNRSPFASTFDKGTEVAKPGLYSVWLNDAATFAEMTVSGPKAGMHRYTCTTTSPSSPNNNFNPCMFVLDVCHTAHDYGCPYGMVNITTGSPYLGPQAMTITASTSNTGDFSPMGVMVYLYAIVTVEQEGQTGNILPSSVNIWDNYTILSPSGPTNHSSTSGSIGTVLVYPPPSNTSSLIFTVRVGVSSISINHAMNNLLNEQTTFPDFETIYANMDNQWETLLQGVQVTPSSTVTDRTEEEVLESWSRGMNISSYRSHSAHPDNANEAFVTAALRQIFQSTDGLGYALQAGWLNTDIVYTQEWLQALERYRMDRSKENEFHFLSVTTRLIETMNIDHLVTIAMDDMHSRQLSNPQPPLTSIADLTVFYTMLFITYCAPSTYSDSDGTYLGFDNDVHTVDWLTDSSNTGGVWYSDLSLWDTHRSQAVWLGLALPLPLRNQVISLITMTNQGGHLPRWPFANIYTGDMVGSHGVELIYECVLTGSCSFPGDTQSNLTILSSIIMNAITEQDTHVGNSGFSYAQLGYAPFPDVTASTTLEFAYDDYVAATVASLTGNTMNATVFQNRAQSYRNIWNAVNSSMYPKFTNGTFMSIPSLYTSSAFPPIIYTEGSAGQWSFSVPHNVSDLVQVFGNDAYVDYLQVLLANQTLWTNYVNNFLPNPWCWLGNEPSMLLPFQHAWADKSNIWRSQFWARWHLRTYYQPTVDGMPGNDDYGTLSSWAVFTYLGFYPITATATFVLFGSVFQNATIQVPTGWLAYNNTGPNTVTSVPLIIQNPNASATNIFLNCAYANGVQLAGPFVTYQELWPSTQGQSHGMSATTAVLRFAMTDSPSYEWCT